ncbi:MAG: hypothetical protein LBS60_08015 [Deltaproteobacteria bacterium]|jgi:hypothetical protein|nr:hypothetical protein [Deltaproteobacteria bacterium]
MKNSKLLMVIMSLVVLVFSLSEIRAAEVSPKAFNPAIAATELAAGLGADLNVTKAQSNDQKIVKLERVDSFFDGCPVLINLDFPGYSPRDYFDVASDIYRNNSTTKSNIYNVKNEDKSPDRGFYIQLINDGELRGFLVRKSDTLKTVNDDSIVNGILLKFEEDELHGPICSNPIIFNDGKRQKLPDALKNNRIFKEIIKTKEGFDWNSVG